MREERVSQTTNLISPLSARDLLQIQSKMDYFEQLSLLPQPNKLNLLSYLPEEASAGFLKFLKDKLEEREPIQVDLVDLVCVLLQRAELHKVSIEICESYLLDYLATCTDHSDRSLVIQGLCRLLDYDYLGACPSVESNRPKYDQGAAEKMHGLLEPLRQTDRDLILLTLSENGTFPKSVIEEIKKRKDRCIMPNLSA